MLCMLQIPLLDDLQGLQGANGQCVTMTLQLHRKCWMWIWEETSGLHASYRFCNQGAESVSLTWFTECRALEALVHVGAAEVGVPRVLFAAVKLIISPFASDNELAQASRSEFLSIHDEYCCFCCKGNVLPFSVMLELQIGTHSTFLLKQNLNWILKVLWAFFSNTLLLQVFQFCN